MLNSIKCLPRVASGRKKLDCAQNEFNQLLQQIPTPLPPTSLWAKRYDGLGRLPKPSPSSRPLKTFLRSEPNLHFGLGYLYWKSQQYD